MVKRVWKLGETKKDRKGRTIFFKGYSKKLTDNGTAIELWEPEEWVKKFKFKNDDWINSLNYIDFDWSAMVQEFNWQLW